MTFDPALVRRAPKVILHDHLDGGLRPDTVLELADEQDVVLPAADADQLASWFHQGGQDADLVAYLNAFEHTVAVLQTPAAIERVTRESLEDLDADGVVYAELRYAPELSSAGGMSLDEVLDAVAAGIAAAPATIEASFLACIMRHQHRGQEVVAAALRARERGLPVVGVDLAGPEAGFPAAGHAEALRTARDGGLRLTLHAGEADGPGSIADALDQGAERLGHGVRIADDVLADGTPGETARRVLAGDVLLEVCPTSNVHTGVVPDLAAHPLGKLFELGFNVTVSTDNRLMSGVTATSELVAVAETFGWGLTELEALTLAGARGAFIAEERREALVDEVRRGYAALLP
jgi:adenosine deaminase